MAYSYRRLRAEAQRTEESEWSPGCSLNIRNTPDLRTWSLCLPSIHPYHSLISFRSLHKGHLFTEGFLIMLFKSSTSPFNISTSTLSTLIFSSLPFIIIQHTISCQVKPKQNFWLTQYIYLFILQDNSSTQYEFHESKNCLFCSLP